MIQIVLEQGRMALLALSLYLLTIQFLLIHLTYGAKPNEPSWTLLPITPTMTQTMHLWKFRKKQALALYICATRLLKTKRDDDGTPILPSYDDQLRVIIVGEARVGKSHILRN
jgi:hypothetical protein